MLKLEKNVGSNIPSIVASVLKSRNLSKSDKFGIAKVAALHGDFSLLKQMVCTNNESQLNELVRLAAQIGHQPMVVYMVEKGANDYLGVLYKAINFDHFHLFELYISKCRAFINNLLVESCLHGRKKFVEYTLCYGANDYKEGLLASIYGNHPECFQLILSKFNDDSFVEEAVLEAVKYGRKDMLELIKKF